MRKSFTIITIKNAAHRTVHCISSLDGRRTNTQCWDLTARYMRRFGNKNFFYTVCTGGL